MHVSLGFQLLGNFNLLTQPLSALLSPLLPPSLPALGRPLADASWQGVYKSVNGFLGFCCNVLKNRVSWKTTYMLPYCANLVAARSLS